LYWGYIVTKFLQCITVEFTPPHFSLSTLPTFPEQFLQVSFFHLDIYVQNLGTIFTLLYPLPNLPPFHWYHPFIVVYVTCLLIPFWHFFLVAYFRNAVCVLDQLYPKWAVCDDKDVPYQCCLVKQPLTTCGYWSPERCLELLSNQILNFTWL
jgi:hypothetical protein